MQTSTSLDALAPPANDAETAYRWRETAKARRVLESSTWRMDLKSFMIGVLGEQRAQAWGQPTIATNLLKSVVGKIAQLYRIRPTESNLDANEAQLQYMKEINPFKRSRRHNRLVIGLRENLIRVHWNKATSQSGAGVDIELVTPDYVTVEAAATAPTVPLVITHTVRMKDPLRKTQRDHWFRLQWDVRGEEPVFRVLDAERNDVDRSKDFEIEGYEWVDSEGVPYLPWVLYHAEDTGCLFDPDAWDQILDGTFVIAMMATMYLHVVKNASWAQAYSIDAVLKGTKTEGEGTTSHRSVQTDQRSLLQFASDGNSPQLGMLDKPADPKYVIEAIIEYADWVLSQIGLSVSQTDAPQSGVALTIRRDGAIRLQQEYVDTFRLGDEQLLSVVAKVSNTFSVDPKVPALPVDGWRVKYPAAPDTRNEVVEKLDNREKQITLGVMSLVDLMIEMNPDLTRFEATAELVRIGKENAMLGGLLGDAPDTDSDADPKSPVE